jgi:Sugar phosphate permease
MSISTNIESAKTIDSSPANATGRKQVVTATTASLLGWAFDLFDLFLLLYVAPTVGKLFFPASSPILQLAATYASFSVTLLMRPIGSAVFGSYSDRIGRKKAMIVSVTGVGVSTALFGALPTVEQIGVPATILFIALRLIQGIFVGGVIASTHTISTETVPPKWRGLMSGLIGGGGAGLGALFASGWYFVVSSVFPGSSFDVWGWRVMFYAGIVSAILGIFVYRSLEESPLWLQSKNSDAGKLGKAPVRAVLSRQYLPILLVNLLIVAGGGTAYYLTSGYLPTFLKIINELPAGTSSLVLMTVSIVNIIASGLVGHASEFLGRRKTMLITGIVCLIGFPVLYAKLAAATDIASVYFYASALVFLGNASYAPVLVFLNERFPTAIRSTGVALSWNVGFAVGGMMPTFVSLASGSIGQIPATLGYFLAGIIIVYLIGTLVISETKGQLK